MPRAVLGLSCWYHDSAAALVVDGRVVAAAHEERGSRVKFDARFPATAVRTVLREAGCSIDDVEAVVLADKPLLKTDRILMTALALPPGGRRMFVGAFGPRGESRFAVRGTIRRQLARAVGARRRQIPPVAFVAHHEAHAAHAFFTSPYDDVAVLCLDAVGEWSAMSAWTGCGDALQPLWEQRFPHSPGLLYSAVTRWLGLRANYDEYKVMGLAGFGQPRFFDALLERLVSLREDGSFRLAPGFLAALDGRRDAPVLTAIFGRPPIAPPGPDDPLAADVAASVQAVLEEILLRSARALLAATGKRRLCLGGGVALNGVANGRLLREGGWEDVWAPAAPGDAGNALGAALAWSVRTLATGRPRGDALAGARLGRSVGRPAPSAETLAEVAARLASGQVIGWCQGRAEWGPRALGGRSILADPRNHDMREHLNLIVKQREGYRPFAPVMRADDAAEWFPDATSTGLTRWMLATLPAPPRVAKAAPAAVHVDGSARVQVLHDLADPLAELLAVFGRLTGVPLLINTSFNGPDEPIVDDEADARRTATRLGLDALVIGNQLLEPSSFDPPPAPLPSLRVSDFLPAALLALGTGFLWPSWRASAPSWSLAGIGAALLVAAWARFHLTSWRRARRGLIQAVRRLFALPGLAALYLAWLIVVLPVGLVGKAIGFDPLDLRGEDTPRRPPSQGPFGAPY